MGSRWGLVGAIVNDLEALHRAEPAEPAAGAPHVAWVTSVGSQQKHAGALSAGRPRPTGSPHRRSTTSAPGCTRLTHLTPQWSAICRACALAAVVVLCVLCAVGARSFAMQYRATDETTITHAQVGQTHPVGLHAATERHPVIPVATPAASHPPRTPGIARPARPGMGVVLTSDPPALAHQAGAAYTTSSKIVELVEVVGTAPTTSTAGGGTALPTCPVEVGPVHTPIDPCKWATQAVLAVVGWLTDTTITSLDGIIGAVVSSQVLLGTPHVLTDQNPAVANLLALLTALALGSLALIIGVQGYALILGPHLGGGFRYAEAREVLPRLLVGAAATAVIPWVIGQFIDFSNLLGSAAVTNSFVPVTAPSLGDLGNGSNPAIEELVLAFVVLGYTVFALLVILQVFVRLATLDLLIVLAPLAMVCWILPQTRIWTERWTTLLCGVLLAQPLQLLTISLGLGLATNLPAIPGFGQLFGGLQATLAEGFLCLATYYVAFKIPRLVSQIGLGSSTLGAALDGLRTGGQLLRTGLMVAGFF